MAFAKIPRHGPGLPKPCRRGRVPGEHLPAAAGPEGTQPGRRVPGPRRAAAGRSGHGRAALKVLKSLGLSFRSDLSLSDRVYWPQALTDRKMGLASRDAHPHVLYSGPLSLERPGSLAAGPPTGGQLLRISQATGAVVQRLRMPAIARPILAFDADGWWMAPAANSGGVAVYHVVPGASAAVPVFRLAGAQYAAWMIGSGHSLWLEVSSGGNTGTLWHLAGAGARAVSHLTLSSFGNQSETQGGASTMAGNAADGLWTVVPARSGTTQEVIRIDPASGTYQTVAWVKPGYSTPGAVLYDSWQAVTIGGSMFLLDPATDSGTYPYQPEGFSALYQISPTAGR
jgi:hypothetical protein